MSFTSSIAPASCTSCSCSRAETLIAVRCIGVEGVVPVAVDAVQVQDKGRSTTSAWLLEATTRQPLSLSVLQSRENEKTMREAFSTTAAKKGLMLSMVLMVVQQMSGVSAVVFYSNSIFKAAGSSLDKDLSSIVVGACLAGATFVSLFLVDRLGRRVLLLGSGAACFVCNVILGIYLLLLVSRSRQARRAKGK